MYKTYGHVRALENLSLDVRAGEFLSLVGPSGSGKSTLLMVIAGFERPDAGFVGIDGASINHLPPHKRNIGIVFQRYALFPHMTVAENVAYPLRRRRIAREEIVRRVGEALELVKLEGMEARSVNHLSGGQQQRVALARALVFRPAVLLMDEPMSALDKKLREHMQIELKLLQKELDATIILVTHDQEEAMSMADRVAVIDSGMVKQVGTPAALYRHPADAFVAAFLGRMNFLPFVRNPHPQIPGLSLSLADAFAAPGSHGKTGTVLGVRPEDIVLSRDSDVGEPAKVIESSFGGATQTTLVKVGSYELLVQSPTNTHLWRPGETAIVAIQRGVAHVFDEIIPEQRGPVHHAD